MAATFPSCRPTQGSQSWRRLRLDHSDGLTTREGIGNNQPSSRRSRDETLWFATSRGVDHLRGDALHPAAGPSRSRLEFRFTVPSFTAPEKICFRTPSYRPGR